MLSPGTELFLSYVWYKAHRSKDYDTPLTFAEFVASGMIFACTPEDKTAWLAHGIPETRILTTYEKGVGND